MNDLELLRKYEPIVRYTHGELFFPCPVDGYVRSCELHLGTTTNDDSRLLTPRGEVTLETLAELRPPSQNHQHFLRFVDRPLEGRELARWLIRDNRPVFNARGRLARVGLAIRTLDSVFELISLLRGRVPGGTVAAAERMYQRIWRKQNTFPYYARVVRRGGYIVLHYLLFYAMNDWRSSFHGVNDHEADWEQIFIYLEDCADEPRPLWVAGSVHEFPGQDLRRRWDDPALIRRGNHPIIFAAAGSHANYPQPGEYLARYEVGIFKPISHFFDRVRRLWNEILRQGDPTEFGDRIAGLLRFPYVDYARGDGLSVGPGEEFEWKPTVIRPDDGWIENYQGLWGLATTDPFEGESAPAGPKYNRDGTIRQTWSDPIGWTGLHKVATPSESREMLQTRLGEILNDLRATDLETAELEAALPQIGLEVEALRRSEVFQPILEDRQRALAEAEQRLNALIAHQSELTQTAEAIQLHIERIDAGDYGDPTSHIRQFHVPLSPEEIQESRIVETWAAVSVGLLLLGFAVILVFFPQIWIQAAGSMVVAFLAIDAALRRHLTDLLVAISVVLALVSLGVLLYEFFFETIVAVVALLSLLIIVDNFREIRGR
ncbi:hypothetical protein BH23CHL2_BH23CHL2_22230 [soil metagenome]